MRLRFLGTGTSTGVPQLRCDCPTCKSADSRDKRLRASALVTTDDGINILIDCGPDFYHQLLAAGSPRLDSLLITHSHYDHVGGIDDLRPYCSDGPFAVYCQSDVEEDLRNRVPYCFAEHLYPGVPTYDIHRIEPMKCFKIGETEILPLPLLHYKLGILGFKIGQLGYVTDCKTMPDETIEKLQGVDTLVLNALRIKEHLSHLNLEQALELIDVIKPRVAYLTHISHQMGLHGDIENILPANVKIAFDGLEVTI